MVQDEDYQVKQDALEKEAVMAFEIRRRTIENSKSAKIQDDELVDDEW